MPFNVVMPRRISPGFKCPVGSEVSSGPPGEPLPTESIAAFESCRRGILPVPFWSLHAAIAARQATARP